MPAGDGFLTAIFGRFDSDLDSMGRDILEQSQRAQDLGGGFEVFQTEVDIIEDNIQFRMDMAADSAAWQSYQVGRVDAIDEAGLMFEWVLDGAAQHCATCPVFAAGGPYTLETLPGVPGDAPTECNGGCRCDLVPVRSAA